MLNDPTHRTILAVASGLALLPATALAKGGDDRRVTDTGDCGSGRIELKVKAEDSGLEAEAEVDTNRSGQRWRLRIRHDGNLVYNKRKTTRGPSGSFSVERRIANHSGTDRVTATATRNGASCRASVRF
jgi:hypothetical protein